MQSTAQTMMPARLMQLQNRMSLRRMKSPSFSAVPGAMMTMMMQQLPNWPERRLRKTSSWMMQSTAQTMMPARLMQLQNRMTLRRMKSPLFSAVLGAADDDAGEADAAAEQNDSEEDEESLIQRSARG